MRKALANFAGVGLRVGFENGGHKDTSGGQEEGVGRAVAPVPGESPRVW